MSSQWLCCSEPRSHHYGTAVDTTIPALSYDIDTDTPRLHSNGVTRVRRRDWSTTLRGVLEPNLVCYDCGWQLLNEQYRLRTAREEQTSGQRRRYQIPVAKVIAIRVMIS